MYLLIRRKVQYKNTKLTLVFITNNTKQKKEMKRLEKKPRNKYKSKKRESLT